MFKDTGLHTVQPHSEIPNENGTIFIAQWRWQWIGRLGQNLRKPSGLGPPSTPFVWPDKISAKSEIYFRQGWNIFHLPSCALFVWLDKASAITEKSVPPHFELKNVVCEKILKLKMFQQYRSRMQRILESPATLKRNSPQLSRIREVFLKFYLLKLLSSGIEIFHLL